MAEQFGTIRSASLLLFARAVKAHSCGKRLEPWITLFAWAVEKARTGDRLGDEAKAALTTWLGDPCADLQGVHAVQFSRAQAAAELFDGHDVYVKRALDKLLSIGLLVEVRKGTRGFATLYAIGPTPRTQCAPEALQSGGDSVGDTSSNALRKRAETVGVSGGDSPTVSGIYPYSLGDLPLQVACHDQGKRTPIQLNPIPLSKEPHTRAASEGAACAAPNCPVCGDAMERTNTFKPDHKERLWRCRRCWEESWQVIA